jgi:predicted PurR-regulated permease PerM
VKGIRCDGDGFPPATLNARNECQIIGACHHRFFVSMVPQLPNRALSVAALLLLTTGCLLVLWPFLTAIVWSVILVSTSWPAFVRLDRRLGGRRLLAASLVTVLIALVLLVPLILLAMGLADNIAALGKAALDVGRYGLPVPPAWLHDLPVVGGRAETYWLQFVDDGPRLMAELERLGRFAPAGQATALTVGRALGQGVVDIGLSIFLAFFLFVHGEALAARLHRAAERLAGLKAQRLLGLAHSTVAGVIYGILGTALAQGALATLGFVIAGVPGALLLGLATFFLSVVPVGPPLIWSGAALWLFQQGQTGWALFVVAWGLLLVSTVDNVLKPFIISRGANMPFAVVFLGVLGGVLAFGVIGVFLGPTLLAVGYRLLTDWTSAAAPAENAEAPKEGAS